jgi:protein gp37
MRQPNYVNGFTLTLHEEALELPLRWRKPQTIFVNSMSDMFHARVPRDFIFRAFEVMQRAHWHRFQVLTKRSDRLLRMSKELVWPPNVWMGVSVESERYTFRIDHLRETGAAVKFLSLEPLLGPLEGLSLTSIDWAIVGGESGPGARPMNEGWVTSIRDQCVQAGVAFFSNNGAACVRKLQVGSYKEGHGMKCHSPCPVLLSLSKLLTELSRE